MNDIITIPEAPGYRFQVFIEQDDTQEAPWDRSDGHGPVRAVFAGYGRPDKRPGERILHSNRGDHWLYDVQEAMKIAIRDGWGLSEEGKARARLNRRLYGTKRSTAACAVEEDLRFLAGWLRGDWCYVSVCVRLLDKDGEPVTDKYSNALWGIESDCDEYIAEVAKELAFECAKSEGITIEQRREAWRGALKEARERQHWAQRDVATA